MNRARRVAWVVGWLRAAWPRGTDRRDPFTRAWKAWRERTTPRGKLLAAVGAFALPLAMLTRGQVGGFALAVVGALLASSLLLTALPPRGRLRAAIPSAVRQGETVSVRLRGEFPGGRIPDGAGAWLFRCGDGLETPGDGSPLVMTDSGEAFAEVPLRGLARGVHRVEGPTLLREDGLGILRSRRLCPGPAEVAVLPLRARVVSLEGLMRGPGGAEFAAAVEGAARDEEEVVGIRPWRDLDGPRDVHHRAWARTGRLAAVERMAPPGGGVALSFRSGREGWWRGAFLEPAISLCAGIAAFLLERGTLAEFHLDGIPVPLSPGDPLASVERALAGLPPSIDWARRGRRPVATATATPLPLLEVGISGREDGPAAGFAPTRRILVGWGDGTPRAGIARIEPGRILSDMVRL